MKKNDLLIFLLLLLLFTTASNAQILTFDFNGNAGSETTVNSNSNDPNLNVSTISRGAGLSTPGNANRFNAGSWPTGGLADAISGDDYMEFTISPATSYKFSVTSIEVDLQRSNVGPLAVSLRSSVDNYATTLDSEKTLSDVTSVQTFTFIFTQEASTSPITYRFYMYNAESASNNAGFEGVGDDIIVNGAVTLSSPTIGFQFATSRENETNTTFTSANIPVVVTNYPGTQIDVNISVTGGTAEAGDYSFTSPTSLSFTANGTQNITIDINDDADTDNETIIFTLTETSSVSGLIISQSTQTLTIIDDDVITVPPTAGKVFITELINAAAGNDYDYLELFNNSGDVIDLSTCKLVIYSDETTVDRIYDFGVDEFNSDVDIRIPAFGFLIVARGATRSNFNTANSITLNPLVNFNGGEGSLGYYGIRPKTELKLGGTVDTNDGTLIDDTGFTTITSKRYRNIFTGDIIGGLESDQTPGELEYLVYSGGAWVNAEALDGTTTAKDAFIFDDLTINENSSINNIGIISDKNVTVNSGFSLNTNNITINSGGSLIASGTSTITGNATYNRNLPTTNWYLVSSPVSGQTYNDAYVTANGIASGSGSNRGIASYITSSNTWSYLQSAGSGTFNNGQGYSLKRTNSGDISFTGTINTADVSFGVSNAGTGFNLLGNPYTAFINSATLLTDNTANLVSETIWVWNQATSNYETKVTSDAFVLAPAQGFFIRTNATTNLNIAESYQTATGNAFQKSTKTEVVLNMTDGSFERFAKINYLGNATTSFDNGYDGETFSGIANTTDVFTHLVANSEGKKFQVQSLPNLDFENMIVPVGIKAAAGKEITFSAEAMNLPVGINVYLEDRVANTVTLLSYAYATYKVTLTESLDGIGRFYLHTKASGVLSTTDVALDNISIYSPAKSTLRIAGLSQGKASVKIYSLLGKQVFANTYNTTGVIDMNLPTLATGLYVVQLATEKGTLNKKITLE